MKKIRFSAILFCLSLLLCACSKPADGTSSSTVSPSSSETKIQSSEPKESPTSDQSTSEPTVSPASSASPVSSVTPDPKSEEQIFLDGMKKASYTLSGEEQPYFIGRWYDKNDCKITCTDGSSFYFLVDGATGFDVIFEEITTGETPYFAYIIDEGTPKRQKITQPTVALPDSGKHLVQIVADGMCEGEDKWAGEKGFCYKNVTVAEGGRILGVKPTGKLIFFYGDSITEGVNALAPNSTSSHNSATGSYVYYCIDRLNAVNYSIGYGASGIVSVGSFNTMYKAIDYLNSSRRTDDSVLPDVIVINHGTNDSGAPDSQFESELRKTLKRLTEKYPDAPVVYMIPFNQAKAASIRKICGEFEGISVVETEDWKLSYTDGVHPSRAGARIAGGKLAKALIEIFGEAFFS